VELQVAGKPNPPMTAVVRERVGPVDVVVGDQSSTDGGLARALDARFVLVHSGVTSAGHVHDDSDIPVHEEAKDLASAVARHAARS
jgi:ribonucleotide monophosphatase NagD (HAD superfamily)